MGTLVPPVQTPGMDGTRGAAPGPALRYDFAALGPAHQLVLSHVADGSRVLELGCATGYMTRALAASGCEVTVVDVDRAALERARAHAAAALELDLERERLPAHVRADVVLCADVLEHLRSPETVLADLRRHLLPGGRVVVSLPNIAFWRIRWQLLRGRFDYEETGILDTTHLRFFTYDSVQRLARGAGYRVRSAEGVSESFPMAWLLRTPLAALKHKADGALRRLLPRVFSYQWVLVLEPLPTEP